MHKQKSPILIILSIVLVIITVQATDTIRIPLTYAFDFDLINKLPIQISFNHSNVYSTSPTDMLYLLKFNLTVAIQSFPSHQNRERIEIGLKYPSDFISAMAATFKISYDSVEFGKVDYLQVILFDDNYVQSRDLFADGDSYNIHVKYNFGDDMTIEGKPCRLIEGDIIYFEEYLIRQALNKMTKQNMINFRFYEDNYTIEIIGPLQNLPKLTLVRNNYIFKLSIQGNIIHYISALENPDSVTMVGYKSLKQFQKFKFDENYVIFKRTSLIYQVYLYLLYFTLISLLLIYLSRKNVYETSQFIKHILKWVFFKDRISRIEVLKSELQ